MTKYVLKRILLLIPVLLGVLIVVFTITYLTPGDPVVTILGTGYTPEKYVANIITYKNKLIGGDLHSLYYKEQKPLKLKSIK